MRVVCLFLALLALVISPGWAAEAPLAKAGDDAPIAVRAPERPPAEPPSRIVRPEPPDRSLLDVVPSARTRDSLPHRGTDRVPCRPTSPRRAHPSPALHLELCVFLC